MTSFSLPNSLLNKKELVGVDTDSFYELAVQIFKHIVHLVTDNRNVLLEYGGIRFPVSLLWLLRARDGYRCTVRKEKER